MRTIGGIAVILAALAVTLGLSISSALREQERLMMEFTGTTRQQAHASVKALSVLLDELDQDTRMLADLLERSAAIPGGDLKTERRVWEGAFHALAVVVAQYRLIAFVDADGFVQVLAADPTESRETVTALLKPTLGFASEVSLRQKSALGPSVRLRDRSFLLYGTPVRRGGSIIVASDAKIFLGSVAWTPIPIARLFVTDPAGLIWAGCETSKGCEIAPSDKVPNTLPTPPSAQIYLSRGNMIASAPAVQVSERLERPTGAWTITWLASTEPLVERERSLVSRVILTSLAAAIAVGAVGAAMFRQHKRALTLESRLQVAQALVRAEKLITVGVLSAGIAHEIGNPLAVIRGRAESVLDHQDGPTRSEDMRVIIKHIDNISSTIRQLLDFSRRQTVAPSTASLGVAAGRAKELLQWKLAARGLSLEVRMDSGLRPLAANPDQLQQVLVNLFLNACDASERGQSVLLTAHALGEKEIEFSVMDHGGGVASEHMHAVFDPFFTTKKRGEGTGLGLTIVAGIVRNHGGQISLASNPGHGTIVTVRWPAAGGEAGRGG